MTGRIAVGGAWRSVRDSPWTAAACAVLAHLPALRNKLACDDATSLRHNPSLRTLHGLWHLLLFSEALPASDPGAEAVYRPASAAFDWLTWQLVRSDAGSQHAISIGLHALAAALLVRMLATYGVARPVAAVTGLLFAVHPVTAEAVGALSARPILLGAIVLLLVLHRMQSALPLAAGVWALVGTVVAALCHEVLALAPLVFLAASIRPREERRPLAVSLGGILGVGVVIALPSWVPLPVTASTLLTTAVAIAIHDAGVVVAPMTESPFFTPATEGTLAVVGFLGIGAMATLLSVALTVRRPAWVGKDLPISEVHRGGVVLAFGAPLAFAAAAIRGGVASDRGAYLVLVAVALTLAPIAGALIGRWSWTAHPLTSLAPFALALGMVPLTWASDIAWRDDVTLRRTLVANDPKDPEADLARALLALDENDIMNAYPVCRSYAATRPGSIRANLCIGLGMLAGGNALGAVVYLRPYARAHPEQEAARRGLFAALLATGNSVEARATVVAWQTAFPKAVDVELARAELLKQGAW